MSSGWFASDFVLIYTENCQNFSRQDISPSSPPSLNFRTNFPVDCGGNYVRNKSAGDNVTRVTCQQDGKWSDFPSCICKFISLCRFCEPRDSLPAKGRAFCMPRILSAESWTS